MTTNAAPNDAGRAGRSLRVLLLADDCNPDWPSLPVVGFKMCRAIAEQADVVVATHVRNRAEITRAGLGRAEVAYIDNEYIAAPMYKLSRLLTGGGSAGWTANTALRYPSYLAFEREVYKRFGAALKRGEFDVVHRVTPMSPAIPSPIARKCPVPFVLGPLNGGLRWPAEFTSELRREREWFAYVRNVSLFMPYFRSTYTHAAAILAGFEHTLARVPASAHARAFDFPEVGIDPELFATPARREEGDRATFLFVGRLVPLKCVDVLVEAFSRGDVLRRHRLVIVGDGPERPRLEAMIREHRLESCVELVGWKTQAEVGDLMRRADVFAFPSIKELGAGVVVEAMACGLACIVVDYGGPGGLVSDAVGVKVRLTDKPALTRDFAAEMERLAVDPARRRRLGDAAARFALAEYSWESKARKVMKVYDWVLDRSGTEAGAPHLRVTRRSMTRL